MKDERSKVESSQVDKIIEPWKAFQAAVKELTEAFYSLFVPWMAEVAQSIRRAYVSLCRIQLYFRLSRRWWIPSWLAKCLSNWCPERWLPELRLGMED